MTFGNNNTSEATAAQNWDGSEGGKGGNSASRLVIIE
jgi:hypothetical protein